MGRPYEINILLRELANSDNAITDAQDRRNELPWWAWLRTRRMNKLIIEMIDFRNENRVKLHKLKEKQ